IRRAIIVLLALCASSAFAHKPSDAYLTLERDGVALSGQWDIALRDVDNAITLDANGDGDITWGEVRAKHAEIAAYALERLQISSAGHICPLTITAHAIDSHTDGAYAVLSLAGRCPERGPTIAIDYRLFFDVAKIVTAFTVAHSITLSLAALNAVTLPSRWIESAIAMSVVLAALNNLFPIVARGRWIAAFAFGLVHGFGFASALQDLGLPS